MKEINWEIHGSIERLETIKNKIVNFWQWQSNMDEAQRTMWIGDVQDVYYQIFTAWDLNQQNADEENSDYNAIQLTLRSARSRVEQVISELRSMSDNRAIDLEKELKEVFEESWKPLAVESGFKELLSEKCLQAPDASIVKISDTEFQLPCSICGEIAFIFRVEIPHHVREKRLVYKGLTHTGDLDIKYAPRIFDYLNQDKIAEAHKEVERIRIGKGIDAYCPDCNSVFCHGHYWLKEEWDEGFYDCTYGICPHGHRRMVDD